MKTKVSHIERQLITLEKDIRKSIRLLSNLLSKIVNEINPKSRTAVRTAKPYKGIPVNTSMAVIEALKLLTVVGFNVYPPVDVMLSPNLWRQVRRIMRNNGGQWKTYRGCFEFDTDPRPMLTIITLHGKAINRKKETSTSN